MLGIKVRRIAPMELSQEEAFIPRRLISVAHPEQDQGDGKGIEFVLGQCRVKDEDDGAGKEEYQHRRKPKGAFGSTAAIWRG